MAAAFRFDRAGFYVVANLPEGTKAGDAVQVRRADGSQTVVLLGALATGDDGTTVGIPDRKASVRSILAAAASGIR